jgi:hemerythrin superfamily protein
MDGFEFLTRDHREITRLFDEYEETGDPTIVREICFELALHAEAEETVLYPAVRSLAARGSELANRAEYEHATVKELIENTYEAAPAEIADLAHRMRSAVTAHVDEEEREIFPELRDAGVDVDRLGEDLEQAKENARPRAARAAS